MTVYRRTYFHIFSFSFPSFHLPLLLLQLFQDFITYLPLLNQRHLKQVVQTTYLILIHHLDMSRHVLNLNTQLSPQTCFMACKEKSKLSETNFLMVSYKILHIFIYVLSPILWKFCFNSSYMTKDISGGGNDYKSKPFHQQNFAEYQMKPLLEIS